MDGRTDRITTHKTALAQLRRAVKNQGDPVFIGPPCIHYNLPPTTIHGSQGRQCRIGSRCFTAKKTREKVKHQPYFRYVFSEARNQGLLSDDNLDQSKLEDTDLAVTINRQTE